MSCPLMVTSPRPRRDAGSVQFPSRLKLAVSCPRISFSPVNSVMSAFRNTRRIPNLEGPSSGKPRSICPATSPLLRMPCNLSNRITGWSAGLNRMVAKSFAGRPAIFNCDAFSFPLKPPIFPLRTVVSKTSKPSASVIGTPTCIDDELNQSVPAISMSAGISFLTPEITFGP